MLKFGYITELDMSNGMVRVHFTDEDIVSNPLPVSVPASKEDKYSFPFVINEHVCCLMDENCEFGVVIGAIYNQKIKPPQGSGNSSINISIGGQKLEISVDRESGDLKIKSNGSVTVESPDVKVVGNLTVLGNVVAAGFAGAGGAPMNATAGITSNEDIQAAGVSLKGHTHIGAGSGNPTSGPS